MYPLLNEDCSTPYYLSSKGLRTCDRASVVLVPAKPELCILPRYPIDRSRDIQVPTSEDREVDSCVLRVFISYSFAQSDASVSFSFAIMIASAEPAHRWVRDCDPLAVESSPCLLTPPLRPFFPKLSIMQCFQPASAQY